MEPQNAEWSRQLVSRLDGPDALWAALELGRQGDRAHEAASWQIEVMAAVAAWLIDPSSPDPLRRIAEELLKQERVPYEVVQREQHKVGGGWKRVFVDLMPLNL